MAYRNITRDDFNQVLQSLGDDPAILTDEISPNHLCTTTTTPWFFNLYRKWMESTSPKQGWFNQASASPLLLIFITLLGLAGGLAYIALQLQALETGETRTKDYSSIQNHLGQIQAELNALDERMDEQHESFLLQLEALHSKYKGSVKLASNTAPLQTDAYEIELKKWRHLGIGQNKHGSYALLHDGQQTVMLNKNQAVKGAWRLADFNSSEAVLLGPNEKRIVLPIQ